MNSNFINLTNTFHSKFDDTIKSLESRYKEDLRKRDDLIATLTEKLDSIEIERDSTRTELAQLRDLVKESKTADNTDPKSIYEYVYQEAHVVPDWNEKADMDAESIADVTFKGQKENIDLLIAGDSCVKHLDVNRILPGRNNDLLCKRGGNITDIRNEVMKYNSSHDVAHCVIHVGTNLIPNEPPHVVSAKIISLMKELRVNMPKTSFHFSEILPKYDVENDIEYTAGINLINWWVHQYTSKIGFSCIGHPQFNVPENRNFICKDGVHPSFKGVAQMAKNIKY